MQQARPLLPPQIVGWGVLKKNLIIAKRITVRSKEKDVHVLVVLPADNTKDTVLIRGVGGSADGAALE